MSDDVATCEACGAPLLQRSDEDGREWIKCIGDHCGDWIRFPFLDADKGTDEWRERLSEELTYIGARWDRSDRTTTNFNGFMQDDHFVELADGHAVLVAIGALEEDEAEGPPPLRSEAFSVADIAGKLGWPIGRTLDGLSLPIERELVDVVPT